MIGEILTRDIVLDFFNKVAKIEISTKEIPNRVCEEKINKKEYLLYIATDAIIKYAIIIEDEIAFAKYLEQLYRILKKVNTHNEIIYGINKLIVKTVASLYGITDLDDIENKKVIIRFIYEKYITNGYFFHSFPSVYIQNVKNNGLDPVNYLSSISDVKEISEIFSKYKTENVFSKKLDSNGIIPFTDSFFMACFYANNSPLFLQEMCDNLYKRDSKKFKFDSFLLKNYSTCIDNIGTYCKIKEVSSRDKNRIIEIFKKNWNLLNIDNSYPVVAIIPRSIFNKNSLLNYNDILSKIDDVDIYTSVAKILDTKYNDEDIAIKVSPNYITLIKIPMIKDYYREEKKEKTIEESSVMNEYGSATVIALIGVLFISLGVIIMTIMLGIGA